MEPELTPLDEVQSERETDVKEMNAFAIARVNQHSDDVEHLCYSVRSQGKNSKQGD